MKKKKEEALHELIHSLTPSEKKYIRKNIAKFHPEQQNKKLLLFDTLNKNKHYNQDIEKAAYQTVGYNDSYLAADRNLLYNVVLSGLCDCNADSSAAVSIFNGLEKSHLLFEKKLFEQALEQIAKTKKQALLHESWGAVLELMRLEQRCLKTLGDIDGACILIDSQARIWQKQARNNHLTKLHYKSMQLRMQLSKVRNEQYIGDFNNLMQDDLLQNVSQLDGFFEQFHFWECHCNYNFVIDNKAQELACNKALIELMNEYEWIKKDQPLNYLVVCTRILAIERTLYPEHFSAALAQYRSLANDFTKQNQEAESIIFIFSYNYELDQYILQQSWDKALAIIPNMQQKLQKYQVGEEFKMTCYYRFACTYFFNALYSQATDCLTLVLNNFAYSLRPDVHHISLILQIIIHYELNNRKLMPYLIQTAKYHLEKKAALYQTEHLLLFYLKRLIPTSQKSETKILMQLETALLSLFEQQPSEKKILDIFNFSAWIKNKLERLVGV